MTLTFQISFHAAVTSDSLVRVVDLLLFDSVLLIYGYNNQLSCVFGSYSKHLDRFPAF